MIKKLVSISLFIFFAVVIVIFIGGLFSANQGNTNSAPPVATSTESVPVVNLPVEVSPGTKTISLFQVSKHNQASDCWQAISDNVYDFTPFLNQHPAGAESMIPYCGKDATSAYDTKGGRGDSHSGKAERMLPTYFVGRLSQ
jgi:cytochrome b involved in lipid metabolism